MKDQRNRQNGVFIFKGLVWVFIICILIQVFLAGVALFADSSRWASHTGFAKFLMIPPLLMLVDSIIARLPVSIRWHCAGLMGMIVLMFASAMLPSSIGFVSALHPVIAVLLFGLTMNLVRKTNDLTKKKEIRP